MPEDGTLNAAHRNPLPCSHCSGLASEETAATHRSAQRIPTCNPPKIRCKWRVKQFKGDLSSSLCPRQTFLVNRGACQPHARGAHGVYHHRVRTPRRGVPARVPREERIFHDGRSAPQVAPMNAASLLRGVRIGHTQSPPREKERTGVCPGPRTESADQTEQVTVSPGKIAERLVVRQACKCHPMRRSPSYTGRSPPRRIPACRCR